MNTTIMSRRLRANGSLPHTRHQGGGALLRLADDNERVDAESLDVLLRWLTRQDRKDRVTISGSAARLLVKSVRGAVALEAALGIGSHGGR